MPLAAALVYGNTLASGFVWDDRFLIVENPRVQSLSRLEELLTHDYVFVAETDLAYGYYRPVSSLSLALDYAVWGANPFGFHLTNLLLHAAASALVVLLALGLRTGRGVAWSTGLLFALHPIHTESVAWISGRTDLLAFLLGGGSFALFLAARRAGESGERSARRRRLGLRAGSWLLLALALLAKEMAAVVPLWIVCVAFWSDATGAPGKRLARATRAAAPWFAVVVLYAIVRFVVVAVPPPAPPAGHSLAGAAMSAPPTVARYFGWMALPVELSAYVQNPYVTRLTDPRLFWSLLALTLVALLLGRLARARQEVRLLAAMLALSFAPILNFVRIAGPADMGALMAERFAYLPSFPFLLLVVLAFDAALSRLPGLAARQKLAATGLLAAAPLLAWGTIDRNRDWHDEVAFFEREAARTPSAPLLWTNLAQAEMRAGRAVEAERAIRTAERLAPQAPGVLAARAQWLTLAGRYSEALPIQQRVVLASRKGNALALNNLAFLKRSTGQSAEAEGIVRELVERLPSYPDPWLNLAEIERAEGRVEAAIAAYVRYLDLRPRDLRAVEALAGLFAAERRFADGEALWQGALRGDALDARIWNNIGALRLAAGDLQGARAAVDHALAIDPGYPRARFNLAKLGALSGREAEARAIFEALVREAPASDVGVAAVQELRAAGVDTSLAAGSGSASGENRQP